MAGYYCIRLGFAPWHPSATRSRRSRSGCTTPASSTPSVDCWTRLRTPKKTSARSSGCSTRCSGGARRSRGSARRRADSCGSARRTCSRCGSRSSRARKGASRRRATSPSTSGSVRQRRPRSSTASRRAATSAASATPPTGGHSRSRWTLGHGPSPRRPWDASTPDASASSRRWLPPNARWSSASSRRSARHPRVTGETLEVRSSARRGEDRVGLRPSSPARLLAGLAGRAMGVALGALSPVRRGRPLHPQGVVHAATLTTWGGIRPWGTAALDEPGTTRCLVRLSRAAGVPLTLPDVYGVAVRIDGADLLFASTGTGRVSRYALAPRRSAEAPLTTLLPLRSARGPLQLQLEPESELSWLVSAATPRQSRWEPCARLVAEHEPLDTSVRFDPVLNVPDGLEQYAWVTAVRHPSYVL